MKAGQGKLGTRSCCPPITFLYSINKLKFHILFTSKNAFSIFTQKKKIASQNGGGLAPPVSPVSTALGSGREELMKAGQEKLGRLSCCPPTAHLK